jgi:hypothetical protein
VITSECAHEADSFYPSRGVDIRVKFGEPKTLSAPPAPWAELTDGTNKQPNGEELQSSREMKIITG